MHLCFVSLTIFSFFIIVHGTVIPFSGQIVGTAGNGTIWYQSDANSMVSLGHIVNPITVSITYASGTPVTEATVCFNSDSQFPISGVNLASNCPNGGLGYVSNATEIVIPSANSKAAMDTNSTTYSASIYAKPTTMGTFITTIPDNKQNQTFQLSFSGQQCSNSSLYPIGPPTQLCQDIPIISVNTQTSMILNSGESTYFQMDSGSTSYSTNEIVLFLNRSEITLKTQSGYYPTDLWYLETNDEQVSDNLYSSTILTPGSFAAGETFFFRLTNTAAESIPFFFNTTSSSCDTYMVGSTCSHSISANLNPVDGIFLISGKLVNLTTTNSTLSNNDGSPFSFDCTDDDLDEDFAYFTISEYPAFRTPYFIRVSVANNDVNDDKGAPGLFAKKGGYPSAQSNHYNVSTQGDVVHQIVIEIDDEDVASSIKPESTWYFAVQLPVDFSIWIGGNCAGECGEQEYGVCMCNDQTCEQITSEFANTSQFYRKPNSLLDSGGACACFDDDYNESFNCSEIDNPYFWLWITLISFAMGMIFVVAIGVPLVCWLTNKRKADSYDSM